MKYLYLIMVSYFISGGVLANTVTDTIESEGVVTYLIKCDGHDEKIRAIYLEEGFYRISPEESFYTLESAIESLCIKTV